MEIQPKQFTISDYLNRDFSCACGQVHRCGVGTVLVEKGALARVPELIRRDGYSSPMVICDCNTKKAAGEKLAALLQQAGMNHDLYCFDDPELVPDEKALGAALTAVPENADMLVAMGTGTLNDLCKYLSYRLGIPYIIVATAPSMDGFASVGAPLITDCMKITYDAHSPRAIIGDLDILCQAPMDMINAGMGDILGKYTCLTDWKLVHLVTGEYYCPVIVEMVEESLRRVRENSNRVASRDPEAIKAIMEALVLTGIAMSFVGNSRPASGSEHHLSHYWEMKFLREGKTPVLHGRKVGVGAVVISYMYHELLNESVDFGKARETARQFDLPAWEDAMRRAYGKAAPGVLALEQKTGKNTSKEVLTRLDSIEQNWNGILEAIQTALPETAELEALLAGLGAPTAPSQVGVGYADVKDGVYAAKELRDRYTLLQLLWDLGLLETYATRAAEHFSE